MALLPVEFRKIIRSIRYFLNYHLGRTRLHYKPSVISIEASSFCNQKCMMCPHSFNHSWKDGHMEMQLFKKIIDEIRHYAFRVILQFRGEVLLNKNLVAMIQESKSAGLTTGFNTNATILDEALSDKLINSGLDTILFSFNGETKEVHDSISQVETFEKMMNNVVGFLRMKQAYSREFPRAYIQVLKFNGAQGESGRFALSDAFKARFNELPVHWMGGTWACNRSGSSWQKSGMRITTPRFKYMQCRWMWTEMVVGWDGKVFPCCMDFNEDYVLGDASAQPLLEIWNNGRMVALRKTLMQGKYKDIDLCRNCDVLWSVEEENTPMKKKFSDMLHVVGAWKKLLAGGDK